MLVSTTNAQRSVLRIGFNVTHFGDWNNKIFLNFFNPELDFTRSLNDKFRFSTALNVFYGEGGQLVEPVNGKVISRLIFSNDYKLEYIHKGFITGVGPSLRYRNEKRVLYRYPQPNPFEIVIDPKKSHIDFGGVVSSGYGLNITGKSTLAVKLTYRFYNAGVNPVSVGIFYGRGWN